MAGVKISELPAATVPLAGTELLAVVQGGVTKQVAVGGTIPASQIINTPSGTVAATNVQGAINEIVSDLAASSGSNLVGFLQAGTGAATRTAQAKMRDVVSVKDFGAVGDGVADDTAAIQAAINYTQDNNRTLEFETGGKYKITGTLAWKHGQSSTDAIKYNVRVKGNNAIIYPSGSATAVDIVPRCTFADRATGRGEADIDISDLWVDGYLSPSSAKALNVGRAGFQCSNFEWSSVYGLTVSGFNAGNEVVLFVECRHINVTNMAIRAGSCGIAANTASTFCGDMVFHSCEFTGTASSRPINMNTGAASAEVRGITFSACDIYGTGTLLSSTGAASLVADIWFDNGCQFDGPGSPAGEIALAVQATGGGKLSQIHVIQAYFVNYTGAVIYANTETGGVLTQFNVQGGGINNITCAGGSGNAAIFCINCESVSIRDVEFDAISATAGQLINIDGCTNVLIHNNKATNSTGINYGVTIGNASNNYSICNNVIDVATGAINDYTGGSPTRQSANNLVI